MAGLRRSFMGPRGIDVRKWRASDVTLAWHRASLGLGAEDADYLVAFLERVDAGTATRSDGLRVLALAGRETERVCDEYGQASEQCQNIKAATVRIAAIIPTLPMDAPATYSTGTVVVAGVLGLGLGLLVGKMVL